MQTLEQALKHIPTTVLRQMACFWEVPEAEEAGRPALLSGLLAQMGRAEVVQQALERLDDKERAALHDLLAAGSWIRASLLAQTYGRLRSPGLASRDPDTLSVTERLHRKGLLFRAFAAQEDWSGAVFFVPGELEPFLPQVPKVTPQDLLQPLASQEVLAIRADRSLHRDIASLLALLQRGQYAPKEDGGWPADLLQDLEALLPTRYPAYTAFCLHLARQARLIAVGFAGTLSPMAEGLQWLRASPWLRVQSLFHAWREDVLWDELATIPELQVEHSGPADLAVPRRRVLRHLATFPQGIWFPLSNWLQFVQASDPGILRSGGAAGRLRVYLQKTGEPLKGSDSWDQVEGHYLRFLLEGPLHSLGLVDWGQQRAEDTFRLTPLGQALLHPEVGPPDLLDEPIIVEGTFDVWAPLEAAPYAVYFLEGCAERIRQDHLLQYRLTRPALQQALHRGLALEHLLALLSGHGRGELPQNVAYTLQEWADAYGQLRLHRPLLLSAEEALLLEEALADTQVRAACGAPLSATSVEVDPERAEALLERLGQLGHLPQVAFEALAHPGPLSLPLSTGQGAALLALLWFWEEVGGKGEANRALARLTHDLEQLLPSDRRAWARRQKKRWLQRWEGAQGESQVRSGDI